MKIIEMLINNFNQKRFENAKSQYLKKYEKTKILPDTEKLEELISKCNINLLSNSKKYGDKYDFICEIFGDELDSNIKQIRYQNLMDDIYCILDKQDKEFEVSDLVCELNGIVSKYMDYYSKTNSFVCDDFDFFGYVKDLICDNVFLDEIDGNEKASENEKINENKKTKEKLKKEDKLISLNYMISKYALQKIQEMPLYLDKKYIFNKANSLINDISQNIDNSAYRVESKQMLYNFIKNYGQEQDFLKKQKDEKILESYGIEMGNNISFINCSSNDDVNYFYYDLKRKKQDILWEKKDFSQSDFVMVRATNYFPYDKQLEIVDELNSRIYINNFLTQFLTRKDMEQEFGQGYKNIMWQDKAIMDRYFEIKEKYSILSTCFRSTKHFTLNSLVTSHEYGNFENCKYIILDPLEDHIDDKNLLNLNEADTYFKTSRENPLVLSNRANLLISLDNFLSLDEKTKNSLKDFDVTIFLGKENVAVDMKLVEMGYIPEEIGKWGYEQKDFGEHLSLSLDNIRKQKGISNQIHFYSNVKVQDDEITMNMQDKTNQRFVEFFSSKYELTRNQIQSAIDFEYRPLKQEELEKIVDFVGIDNVKKLISCFNIQEEKRLDKKKRENDKEFLKI